MKTELTLHWEYEYPDLENGIKGGLVFTDATYGNKKVHLSAKLEELINEELNPENL